MTAVGPHYITCSEDLDSKSAVQSVSWAYHFHIIMRRGLSAPHLTHTQINYKGINLQREKKGLNRIWQGKPSAPQSSKSIEPSQLRDCLRPVTFLLISQLLNVDKMGVTALLITLATQAALPNSGEATSCLFHNDQVRSLETASKNLSSGEKAICVTVSVW